ncbi:carboxypeptidase-like regulatory domain-containing protein [Hymenobacter coalescens]
MEEPASTPPAIACAAAAGQVVNADGEPLIGATLLVKGTTTIAITDAKGAFQFSSPIYQGQALVIEAAGYESLVLVPSDCTFPVLMLEREAGTKIKRTGKRAGQVTRSGKAYLQ